MTTFKQFYQLISEGGAAGHMAHPFDIPTIKTGSQLINAFNAIWKSVSKTPASVKIDGVNVSFKLLLKVAFFSVVLKISVNILFVFLKFILTPYWCFFSNV